MWPVQNLRGGMSSGITWGYSYLSKQKRRNFLYHNFYIQLPLYCSDRSLQVIKDRGGGWICFEALALPLPLSLLGGPPNSLRGEPGGALFRNVYFRMAEGIRLILLKR